MSLNVQFWSRTIGVSRSCYEIGQFSDGKEVDMRPWEKTDPSPAEVEKKRAAAEVKKKIQAVKLMAAKTSTRDVLVCPTRTDVLREHVEVRAAMDCQSCAESCCTLLQADCGDAVPCCLQPRYMTADQALQLRQVARAENVRRLKAKALFIVVATSFVGILATALAIWFIQAHCPSRKRRGGKTLKSRIR